LLRRDFNSADRVVVAKTAILTQLFTVKHKHVSTFVCEQS